MAIFAAMAIEREKRKRIVRKLRNKFRLVIMNAETFEEKAALRLSPMNVIVFFGTIMISLITLTLYLIAFTPLREYIPGYTDVNMRRTLVRLSMNADSIQQKIKANDLYLENYRNILTDRPDTTRPLKDTTETMLYDSIRRLHRSDDDSLLRLLVESQDRFELMETNTRPFASGIGSFAFFTPVKGTLTTPFSTLKKHFGVDIVAGPDEVIKSVLDGTVVFANWTSETGYVIGVQHSNNIFSIYKHNSALLKKEGDYVKAGQVLAIIGNTGELSSGPHLHFELWYNGTPVNPVEYISF
jgi:murein DD-endopeptidase MepM/ murein hydrolase activator NlpD